MVAVTGRGEVEEVAVDGGATGLHLGLKPGPGPVHDEPVPGVVPCRMERLGLGRCWIEREEFCRVCPEFLLRLLREAVERGPILRTGLIGIPAAERGNMRLLSVCVDVRQRIRQEIAVNYNAERGRMSA